MNKPVEGVLVEIYAREASDPLPQQRDKGEFTNSPKRIAACITGTSGTFDFDVPSGRYEVRASKPDWNSTSLLVVVDKQRGKPKALSVPLVVGD
jgi:hypothetical protein